jgi:PIN domain nuclease of toxin-antitoxin system
LILLLDSHVLLWFAGGEPQLGPRVVNAILDERNATLVSVASVWELEIKRMKGRLAVPADLGARLNPAGFDLLNVTLDHVVRAAELPLHHRDPFDRMLVAQAQSEGATLVTGDDTLAAYDVPLMPARP